MKWTAEAVLRYVAAVVRSTQARAGDSAIHLNYTKIYMICGIHRIDFFDFQRIILRIFSKPLSLEPKWST